MRCTLVLCIILIQQKLTNANNETFTNNNTVKFDDTVTINGTVSKSDTIPTSETLSDDGTLTNNGTVENVTDTNTTLSSKTLTDIDNVLQASSDFVCQLQPNSFNCHRGGLKYMYYWDIQMNACREANMGIRCGANRNSFDKLTDCDKTCRGTSTSEFKGKVGLNVTCRLQPDFGSCDGYFPRFYFSVSVRRCIGFAYSGCGGNGNRFNSFQLCATSCTPFITDY